MFTGRVRIHQHARGRVDTRCARTRKFEDVDRALGLASSSRERGVQRARRLAHGDARRSFLVVVMFAPTLTRDSAHGELVRVAFAVAFAVFAAVECARLRRLLRRRRLRWKLGLLLAQFVDERGVAHHSRSLLAVARHRRAGVDDGGGGHEHARAVGGRARRRRRRQLLRSSVPPSVAFASSARSRKRSRVRSRSPRARSSPRDSSAWTSGP